MKSNIEKIWETEEGYTAVAFLNNQGYRCGYIGIPLKHKTSIYSIKDVLDVHEGITYAAAADFPIHRDNTYWLGFDCAHSGDVPDTKALLALCETEEETKKTIDIVNRSYIPDDGTMKDLNFVIANCESLSKQIVNALKPINLMPSNKYTHYNTKKEYTAVGLCKIQVNDIWIDAVIYHGVDEDNLYVRSTVEFNLKFKENR